MGSWESEQGVRDIYVYHSFQLMRFVRVTSHIARRRTTQVCRGGGVQRRGRSIAKNTKENAPFLLKGIPPFQPNVLESTTEYYFL
jgi:hypothetical protein